MLLLAARLALLALIVFAFSRPFFTVAADGRAGNSLLLVVVDESASMGAGNRLAEAQRMASELLGGNRPDNRRRPQPSPRASVCWGKLPKT